jgi:hypothetical protein
MWTTADIPGPVVVSPPTPLCRPFLAQQDPVCAPPAGVNNDFLIQSGSETALVYNDASVNENMHMSRGFYLLQLEQNNFLAGLSRSDLRFVRQTAIRAVLATDMSGHANLVKNFAAHVSISGSDLEKWESQVRAPAGAPLSSA